MDASGSGGDFSFAERLAAPTPTPGGGGACARVALYATSLARMVLGISSRREEARKDSSGASVERLTALTREAEALAERLRRLEGEDAEVFDSFMRTLKLPRDTAEEKASRKAARRGAAEECARVPFNILEAIRDTLLVIGRMHQLRDEGVLRAESDLGVALELAGAAFRGAEQTLSANFPELEPPAVAAYVQRLESLRNELGGLLSGS